MRVRLVARFPLSGQARDGCPQCTARRTATLGREDRQVAYAAIEDAGERAVFVDEVNGWRRRRAEAMAAAEAATVAGLERKWGPR
jgi:hypothetical protein